ncbi:hypothetical protein OIU34_11840 [Pararhizobium sp. BT-229]|uniref:PIN domain-containing protein n=1 Tax=Pararhizobium sp. BT-229 TaxID=2986923 RepID=UPI0021F71613|nr:PIN domain-containing protein [Pararhizobium sp. BT-229]MCV9962590.1 hypothetical protein [Pararhizobium sp. BT-229]
MRLVVFDATTILLMLAPNEAGIPTDSSGNPITFPTERIDGLLEDLAKNKVRIVIPTPALSEALVRAGGSGGAAHIAKLRSSKHFLIEAFDDRAALEVAIWTKSAIDAGDKKGGSDDTWAKVKYDRQIVAIAKVAGATTIYTNDRNLCSFAFGRGIKAIGVHELPLSDATAQMRMFSDAE